LSGIWTETAKIVPSDATAVTNFGFPVAIRNNLAVISTYIFEREGAVWNEITKLVPTDGAESNGFGGPVALGNNLVAVGVHTDDDAGPDAGAVYLFEKVGTYWNQSAKILASDPTDFASFGHSLSISGEILVVGAHQDDDFAKDSGSAYVFRKVGNDWIEEAKLNASDARENQGFGVSVSLSGDIAIIGAKYDTEGGDSAGAAYVFENLNGGWTEVAKLMASDATETAQFGRSVSIDDPIIVIGSRTPEEGGLLKTGAGSNDTGGAYIFDVRLLKTTVRWPWHLLALWSASACRCFR